METPSNNQESSSDHNQPFKTLEEELAHKINHLRFRSREFMQNTASHILTNNNPENLTVNFPDIQMTVLYENPSTLTNFTAFLQENMITNQILQDFTYPPKLNESFINSFRNSINQNKSLGLFEGNIKLKLEIPSKLYYGYYFEKIPIKSMQSLLSFIIFEEYVALTSKIQSDLTFLKPNFCYEYNDTKPIEYIPFLSNIYNTILISTEINTNTNDGNLYNIYILLLSETIDETSPQLKKDIRNKTSSNIEAFKEKKFRNTNYLSSVGNINRRIPIVPEKYKDLWTTHIQIPFKSIERLVQAMDSNNDMKITVRDIIEFSHRKFIHLNEEVYHGMFLEAVKNRPIIFPKEKALETINTTPPLTAEEIQKAVSIHLQKEGSIQKQIYKPYYDVWLLFLKENGEKDLKRPTLPTETSQPIFDQEDLFRFSKTSQNFKSLSTKTLKPVENLSVIKVKPIKSKCYNGVYRAEANIIINNTENIEEIFIDRDIEEKTRNSDAFAKTINGHFIEPVSKRVNDYKAITFYTQNYYQESLRLSRNPDLYLKKDKNPILLYIPENLDFKTTREKEKAFINNKKSSGLSALSPPTISYISDKKELEFEYIEDEIDNVSTINNIPIIRPIESKRAKTSQNDHKRAFYSQSSLRSMQNTSEKLFHASFKPEDCKSLKTKLAKLEPVVDKYAPPSSHQFRDEIPNEKPVLFTTRFKNKPLENPYNMSEHDLRPKESLDKEQKERQRKEREEEINLSMFLGKFVGKKEWIKNFRRADLHRKEGFIDHKHPKFIEKGRYVEPTQIMNNLLRGEANYEENFKLFHRSLRSTDKNLYFGQNMDGKF